jgi:hypothetical protein
MPDMQVSAGTIRMVFQLTCHILLSANYYRIRHVKCDESKPVCNRCTSTRRICDFITPHAGQVSRLVKPCIRFRPAKVFPARKHVLLPKPKYLPSVPFESHEGDQFDYFRAVCTRSFSRYFENVFWDRVVLQVAHSEPSIRRAVIALGSLIRQQSNQSWPAIEKRQDHTVSYLSALQALNRRLDGSSSSLELALIGSLLFGTFEFLRGNDVASLRHLEGGVAILSELSSKSSVRFFPPNHAHRLIIVDSVRHDKGNSQSICPLRHSSL